MLFLIRDAVSAALDMVTPAPAWAAPYGYSPDGPYGGAYDAWWDEAAGDGEDELEGGRRRALRAAAQQPPLPAGTPPGTLPADAFDDSYADEAYDDSEEAYGWAGGRATGSDAGGRCAYGAAG